MIDFTQREEHDAWRTTNDNVMGGISQGTIAFNGVTSHFVGRLSLENNGGFSSVTRQISALESKVDSVVLEFEGDGRTYQLRLATWKGGNRITYKHEFSTTEGQRIKQSFLLNDFIAVFRGRLVEGAPVLVAADIEQVGLLIADKRSGPFELKLFHLDFAASKETR
ncbi:CIA30 family protein [Vibrio sp. SCSIO 43136]|nr:CIA30 family protein [Vibrio sp. SCSIO 43136]USD68320.1 CIA30 family protein [Vibrio sp. SCSIO 43136]